MLRAWLAQATCAFRAGPAIDGLCSAIVSIGNDAGDLDSLVSSIAIASLRPIGDRSGRPLWLPVAPFARCDFRLRQDACLLFKHVGFDSDESGAPTDLLFLDEADPEVADQWRDAGGLGLALVDHNACVPGVASIFGERVVAIVDHHNDEQRHLVPPQSAEEGGQDVKTIESSRVESSQLASMVCGTSLRLIEPAVGSTCSLLVELMDDSDSAGDCFHSHSP